MDGYARDGLVHCTQVSDELTFSREDTDDAKVMAMEYFHPPRSDVWVKVVEVRRDGYGGDARVLMLRCDSSIRARARISTRTDPKRRRWRMRIVVGVDEARPSATNRPRSTPPIAPRFER